MMKKRIQQLLIALAVSFGMTACSSDDNQDVQPNQIPIEKGGGTTPGDNARKDIQLNAAEKKMVGNSNDFAFQLFRQLATDEIQAGKSYMVSPLSITCALGMLNNGASGNTKAQITKVLGFGDSQESVNQFAGKMMAELPTIDSESQVALSNTIFVNDIYKLKADFVKLAGQYYNATPETRNFSDGKTLDAINQWASDHTQQMITEVLSPDDFKTEAVSYLLNAIYFKGTWAVEFDKAETVDEVFEGAAKKMPMMHVNNTFNYMENETCQAVRLTYGNGAYAMTVLLPRNGKTASQVAETLNAATWEPYQHMAGTAVVDVKLPRFETQTDVKLNNVLAALGMTDAFIAKRADFSQFCDTPTCIDLMKQVSKIVVDEKGSEAAAVTIAGSVNTTSIVPGAMPHVNFHANHPFLYVISEQSTGAILFIGQYFAE